MMNDGVVDVFRIVNHYSKYSDYLEIVHCILSDITQINQIL